MNVLAALGYFRRARASRKLLAAAALPGRLLGGCGLLSTVVAAASCQRGETSAAVELGALPGATDAVALPTPSADLVAGFRVAQPEFTYGGVRAMSSRPLPQSLQVLLPSLLGLNPALSGRFSAGHDWIGAVTAEANGTLGWSVGVPVVSGRELVAELSLGADAHLRAQARTGWIELTGLSGGVFGPLSLGVAGNYLLLGSSPTAVKSLAPWLNQHGELALAPEQVETGLSFRLFASGLSLQALHAHLRELWSVTGSSWSNAMASTIAGNQLAELEAQVNDSASAYLGAIEGGDGHLLWQGEKVTVAGDFRTRALPPRSPDASLCRDIAELPTDVRFWVAGSGGVVRGGAQPSLTLSAPDWQQEKGSWQAALFRGFGAFAATFEGRVQLKAGAALADGPWVVGWREQRGASTALAVLKGVPFAAIETTPLLPPTKVGSRVQAKTPDGKVLEWAWAPRGNGIVTAFGAQLGTQWDQWVQKPAGTGWPTGLSPRSCDGLVFAAGTSQGVVLSLSRDDAGLHLQGELELSILGGLTR